MKSQKSSKEKTNKLEDKTITKMKPGDYEIHVLIEATAGLSLTSSHDVDVVISLKAFQKIEYSKVKKNTGFEEVFWNEHFYISQRFNQNDNIEGQTILLQIWDHNKILKDSLIGTYELDAQRIYAYPGHLIEHVWLALTDTQRNFGEIAGYVKVSISLQGQNDRNVELDIEPISSITKQKKVLMPPHVERKAYQLSVDFYQGKNIIASDRGSVDSFLGVQFGQIYQKTLPIMRNVNPEYNIKVSIPVHLPAITDNVSIRLIDFNYLSKQDVLASYYININKLISECSKESSIREANQQFTIIQQRWINFYGPQVKVNNNDQRGVYQLYPDLAPYYIGSILSEINIKLVDHPIRLSQPIKKKAELKPFVYYRFTMKIQAAVNLLMKNKKYKVSIRVGAQQMESEWATCENGFCIWLVMKQFTVSFYDNQNLPDVFVYLINSEEERVCFLRAPTKEGIIFKDTWNQFKPDLSMLKIRAEEAGLIKMEVSMKKTNKKEPPTEQPLVNDISNLRSSRKAEGRIVIDLICAQSLLASDENGSVDPFFVFNYMSSKGESSHKQQTTNPIYFQKIILKAEVVGHKNYLPIIVNAFDQDSYSMQLIGNAFIDLSAGLIDGSVVEGINKAPEPKWYNLTIQNIQYGKFLAGISIISNDSKVEIPKQINLRRKKFNISLFILGLRELKSTGLISVKKPYIQFDMESLNIYSEDKSNNASKNIVTEPKESGSNINIKQANKTTIVMPADPRYWPSLNGKVKDFVLGGIYEPLLGFFSINLREAYERSEQLRKLTKANDNITNTKDSLRKKPVKLQGINEKLILSLRNFIIKNVNYGWQTLGPDVKLNQIRYKKQKLNMDTIVVLPAYVERSKGRYDEQYRELITKNNQYMRIGFDSAATIKSLETGKRNKHYRYVLDQTYEDYYHRVYAVKMGLYDQIDIRIGKFHVPEDQETSLLRKLQTEDTFSGQYKGNCLISEFIQNNQKNDFEIELEQKQQALLKNYMNEVKYTMYLYILQAANIPRKDLLSDSDPYVIVNVGDKEYNFRDRYIEDTNNPQFNLKIVHNITFPVNSTVEIQVWDYNLVLKDQYIGSTYLDAENRIFSQFGKISFNNPIETHNLKSRQSKVPQGLIRFWVDFVPLDDLHLYRVPIHSINLQELDIENKPAAEFEVRVIVWSCSGISSDKEDATGMNDLLVACTFNGITEETDVHYRTQTGEGSFNWRMLFPVKLPLKNNTITFKVYDKDILTRDQYLASGTLTMAQELDQAFENQLRVKLYRGTEDLSNDTNAPGSSIIVEGQRRYDRFQINLLNRASDQNLDAEVQASVEISIDILPKDKSLQKPAGKGRQAPNQHPKLPEPQGRFQWSWNPLTLLTRLVGRKLKFKILMALLFLLLVYVLYNFGYALAGSFTANKLTAA